MTMKRWDGSSFIDLTVAKRWDGSSWVDLTIAKRWDGSSWVDIALPGGGGGSLSATVSDSSVFGNELRIQPPTAPTVLTVGSDTPSSVTVMATGGTGPYTYSWARVSGDSAISAGVPNAATTNFIANVTKNQTKNAVWRCTVTDSLSATTFVDVSVQLSYTVEN